MPAPFLCIGIPVRNEEESIALTINSIVSSRAWTSAKQNRELVVCLNGSTDNTLNVLNSLKGKIPELRIIYSNADFGKTGALNEIAKRANLRASEIYFSDGDVLVQKDTITKTLRALKEKGIEFAAPIIWPRRAGAKPTLTETLYEESIKIAAKEKLHSLTGMGFAVKRKFFLQNPLPLGRQVGDDRFINYAWSEKIRVVHNARIIFNPPSLIDHYRARVRHHRRKKVMMEQFPWLRQAMIKVSAKRNPRAMAFLKGLSARGKAGFILNQAAETIAAVTSLAPTKDHWPRLKSTKIGYVKKR